jgi:hypothetical protein
MEKENSKINKKHENNEEFNNEEEEDIDYEEVLSHKIDKNVSALKNKRRLIVILEHAYLIYKI